MKKIFTTLFALGGVMYGAQMYAQADLSVSVTDGCPPLEVMVTNHTTIGAGSTCSFVISGGTTLSGCQPTFPVTLYQPGEYTITYTYTTSGGAESTDVSDIITVHQPAETPILVVNAVDALVECTNCDLVNDYNSWYVDDILVATDVDEYELVYGFPYRVEITTGMGGCEAETTFTPVGVENINSRPLRLFPNPANNEVRVISSDVTDSYEIRDAVGRIVETGPTRTREFTVEVSSLVNGVYTLLLKNNTEAQSVRFVVLH